MLEKWIGKTITYYVIGEEGYNERMLVAVDARGIYTKDDKDNPDTYFLPFTALRSVTQTAAE